MYRTCGTLALVAIDRHTKVKSKKGHQSYRSADIMYPCMNLVSFNYTSDKKTKYNKNKMCDTVFVFS